VHLIGVVRIDLDSTANGRKDTYTITPETHSALSAALELTTPVSRASSTTRGERAAMQKKRNDEAEYDRQSVQKPRLDLQSRAGNREGTRAKSALTKP